MGKSAPEPPDPRETSAASTSTNVGTAIANAMMGNVNQYTPYGSLEYDQTGTHTWSDPYTGKSYDIPTFSATQNLTPEQQAIFEQHQGTQQNLAGLANQQSGFLQDYMAQPVDLSSENIEGYINDHFRDDFNEQWGRQEESLMGRLANQGIGMGSEAYDRALGDFSNRRSDAYDNLYGNQYGLAQQSILSERNQPINEITALLSGSQVQQPNFVNANQPTIPTTDVGGLINANYDQRLGIWNQQNAQTQNILGGLFGLGSAFLM